MFSIQYYGDNSSQLTQKSEENVSFSLTDIYKDSSISPSTNNSLFRAMILRREHKCPYCNKSFHQSWLLKRHIRVHTGEKPFVCNMCKRCFNQLDTLKRHIRIHTGERPFVCKFCSKTYIDQRSLNTHYKTHVSKMQVK